MVRYDVAILGKFLVADCALAALLSDLSVQQFSHLGGRSQLAIASGVVRIVDTLNPTAKPLFLARLVTTAAENRSVDRTEFIATEFHGYAPV
jgi:hypothetical protein